MKLNMVLSLCASLVWLLSISNVYGQNKIFKVTNYGAVPNKKTDNSEGFLSAWKQACATHGGKISIPLGTYYVSGAKFEGPCNGHTFFEIKGNLKASSGPHEKDTWISFHDVDGLTISGPGTFDGNGPSAWSLNKCHHGCGHRPSSIKLLNVNNAIINGIKSLNSKMFHFHIVQCKNIIVTNVNIEAPRYSPNTDGIHLARSNNISITKSRIATGDDCISVGHGNIDINIESTWCGPGHGFSIGSLGKRENEHDVRGITVKNCTMSNTDNGLRIKTLAPSVKPITVSDVTFQDIIMNNVKNPIFINQYYCTSSPCSHKKDSDININGVKYINIRGTSASQVALNLQCSKSHPCNNLEFDGLNLIMKGGQPTTGVCSSAHFEFLGSKDVPSSCKPDKKMVHGYNWLD